MNRQEAMAQWAADRLEFEKRGVFFPMVNSYIPEGWGSDFGMALDAQPTLTTDPNSSVPAMLTTMIDPTVFKVIFAPNEAANIYGEQRKGTWLDDTAMFPIVEHTGEVSSYGDYAENGTTGANTNWPNRQAYLFQTIKQYGERELERAGLARISWVSELDLAAATNMNKFSNYTYFFGVNGLQNYGALNDPHLTAAINPAPKAYGNSLWITNGVVTATANEVFTDIQSLFSLLVAQSAGVIDQNTKLVLAMSPGSSVALTATNSFNVNVSDLLKKNFPNIEIKTAVQFGVQSTSNPQGIAAGNFVQMFAPIVEGQQTIFCGFNEKMRAHPIVKGLSNFKQKISGGTWGAVIRQSFALAQMVGV